jgi:translin
VSAFSDLSWVVRRVERMDDLEQLGRSAQAALTTKHDARERALPKSRATIRLCANAVRATHRGEFDAARGLLSDARRLIDEMRDDLRDHGDIYYAGFVSDAQKEFAEATITLDVIQGQPLPLPASLGVEWAPYLNGVGESIGELRRHLLDELRRGNLAQCEAVMATMDDFFSLLASLDFPDAITNNLRRTTDAARAIIERTRGDMTAAAVQAQLSDRLAALAARLDSHVADSPQGDA